MLHLCESGGAEKVARDLAFYSYPNEYETHYVVFGEEIGEYEQELLDRGCTIFHWAEPSASYPKYLSSSKHVMQENRYDVVHAHRRQFNRKGYIRIWEKFMF